MSWNKWEDKNCGNCGWLITSIGSDGRCRKSTLQWNSADATDWACPAFINRTPDDSDNKKESK